MTSKADFERAAWSDRKYKGEQYSGASRSFRVEPSGWQCGIPGFTLSGHNTLNTFHGQASISGTDADDAVWQGHWRTHYLPSCLVAQMAIAVLYTTNHYLRLASSARPNQV
jgi:hypothetical protein